MKNFLLTLLLLVATNFATEMSAQTEKKVWVEAGKSIFLKIPAAERGKVSKETTTDTKDFSNETSSVKIIGRQNPDGKIVSIEVIPQKRMLIPVNYTAPTTEGYISSCCNMCAHLGEGWLCCIWCKLEH